MTQVTGRAYISVGGTRLRSKSGATLDIGGVARTPVLSDSGVDGYTEATVAPTINCTINHTADVKLTELRDLKDQTIRFETDTGVTFTISDGFVGPAPVLSSTGEVTLVLHGKECVEG